VAFLVSHSPRRLHHHHTTASWYGQILVERVEGFATDAEWRRAYAENNQFEEQLVWRGTILLKFWLQVNREKQLRRFKDREQAP